MPHGKVARRLRAAHVDFVAQLLRKEPFQVGSNPSPGQCQAARPLPITQDSGVSHQNLTPDSPLCTR